MCTITCLCTITVTYTSITTCTCYIPLINYMLFFLGKQHNLAFMTAKSVWMLLNSYQDGKYNYTINIWRNQEPLSKEVNFSFSIFEITASSVQTNQLFSIPVHVLLTKHRSSSMCLWAENLLNKTINKFVLLICQVKFPNLL